ncbi:quinol:cytochrome c oxidoreductase quinone-binding subunit 2 [Tenacibaculum gallaicum]|uniref:Quinol:cytochrome c oxidoreductase quinone-binding subunit 2 n=1 Tax=Tenacibaculum gallaicum TaxID=561505 RepID=A0A3E0IB83_9FLAO|nr:quinol:cytochrome C oxidoreductase [Tenacibaculum gallaicum]REH55996.1 quinol:cytochrome c oxidoreductase quinone-binding subunit 2 [Tenacibaculum gallaicum]
MYQFSGKLKMLAIALMILGALGTAYNFMSAPKTLEEAKEILAKQDAHHGSHDAKADHAEDVHTEEAKVEKHEEEVTTEEHVADSTATPTEEAAHNGEQEHSKEVTENAQAQDSSAVHVAEDIHEEATTEVHAEVAEAHGEDHGDAHAEHALHQMQNRPWSALYVALLFSLGITLLVLAFYGSQIAAQAGWSVVLHRVMEAISSNLHYVSILMLVFLIATAMHMNHLFTWMGEGVTDPTSPNYDAIIDGKKWYLNTPGWLIRSIVYLAGWNVYRFLIRKWSLAQDNGDLKQHKKNYNATVIFLVFFMITESMASWDWIMTIDPHWFSTLFGWYVLATFLVSALTVIAMVTIYLRSKGVLPLVNDSHIHDLAKFMFGFSVFWTYLWFAQFMLIWYADMPEETTYFLLRFNEYKVPFLAMVVMNFVFPILLLINSDFKSRPWFVILGGVVILAGHYMDLFVMVMPGTVGGQWGFGIGEVSGLLFFIGLFIFATFSAFAKANPVPKGNPYLHESETYHYYNIEHRGEDSNHH